MILVGAAAFAAGWFGRSVGILKVNPAGQSLIPALNSFFAAYGRYPSADDGLDVLYKRTALHEPFLDEEAARVDVFHRMIVYEPFDDGFVLRSSGPDGKVSTQDDVILAKYPLPGSPADMRRQETERQ